MKKNRHLFLKLSVVVVAVMTLFSSCLKENDTYIDFSKVGTLVELPLAARSPNALGYKRVVVPTYTASATPADLQVAVNIASPKPLDVALDVTLGTDAAALAGYNTANKTTYQLLPPNAVVASTVKVNIPAGERVAIATFKINTNVIDKTVTNYHLPISIQDASGQPISNYKTIYYNITVK